MGVCEYQDKKYELYPQLTENLASAEPEESRISGP